MIVSDIVVNDPEVHTVFGMKREEVCFIVSRSAEKGSGALSVP